MVGNFFNEGLLLRFNVVSHGPVYLATLSTGMLAMASSWSDLYVILKIKSVLAVFDISKILLILVEIENFGKRKINQRNNYIIYYT